jgi:putative nucleotidyltransferase with HDIG domain
MNKQVSEIAGFVHDYLFETGKKDLQSFAGPEYRWEHTLRVAQWAAKLAIEEKADVKTCVVAALFHDVSHFASEDYRKHGLKSGEIAREFLSKNRYLKSFVDNVVYAVESHVSEPNPKTAEAKILQDSDTLDRFGYVRILQFGKKAELSNPKNLEQKICRSLAYLDRLEKGEYGPDVDKNRDGETENASGLEQNRSERRSRRT